MENFETYSSTRTSRRLYLSDADFVLRLIKMLTLYNKIRLSSYNAVFDRKTAGGRFTKEDNLYAVIDKMYPGNCEYFLGSAINLGQGAYDSQDESLKLSLANKKEQLKKVKDKLSAHKANRTKYRNSLKLLDDYYKKLKQKPDKVSKKKLPMFTECLLKGFKVLFRRTPSAEPEEMGIMEFRYKLLIPYLNNAERTVGNLTFKLNRINDEIEELKEPKKISFNKGKKYRNYSWLSIAGRSDNTKYRSWGVEWMPKDNGKFDISFVRPEGAGRQKSKSGGFVKFEDVEFSPEDAELLRSFKTSDKKFPLCFSFFLRYDRKTGQPFVLIRYTVDLLKTININDDTSYGTIGIDLNVGHIDIAETDKKGNLLHTETISYKISGNSEENAESLRKAIIKAVDLASRKGKPLVVENLDTSKSKWQSRYRDKKLNRVYHLFPYARFRRMIMYLAWQKGLAVIPVNPAMTSIIGNLKYAENRNISGHQAAAYVIARRGQKRKERIPKEWRPFCKQKDNNWGKWSILKEIKDTLPKPTFAMIRISANTLV